MLVLMETILFLIFMFPSINRACLQPVLMLKARRGLHRPNVGFNTFKHVGRMFLGFEETVVG